MKQNLGLICFIAASFHLSAQSVGIGTSSIAASAALEIKSNKKGLLIPRTSSASRIAIVSPAKGLLLYDTTTSSFWFHNGSSWVNLSVVAAGGSWVLTGNSGTNPAINFIGTTDANPLLFRVKNTWAGIIDSALNNTAIGFKALTGSNSGNTNSAFGSNALAGSTPGTGNTAVGNSALRINGTGANFAADEGRNNTAVGHGSMQANTTGLYNTAIGVGSLGANTSGYFNAAMGYGALGANTFGRDNTAIGLAALNVNVDGQFNTAIGSRAMQANIAGINNTATGAETLYLNAGGQQNTANGFAALYSNIEGNYNTATGAGALNSSTANWNTADGAYTMYLNKTGYSNVAIGASALYKSTDLSNMVAIGDSALYNQGPYVGGEFPILGHNTAVGSKSLFTNTYGQANTASGYKTLYNNSNGAYNTAMGIAALNGNISGSYNTSFGAFADVSGSSLSNATAIGYDAVATASNQVMLGNSFVTAVKAAASFVIYSDGRFKENIKHNVPGLEFIKMLKPVTYNYNVHKLQAHLTGNNIMNRGIVNSEQDEVAMKTKEEKIYTGFVAQDVEAIANKMHFDFSGLYKPQTDTDAYGLSYADFVVPLVKAVQEQQVMIEKLNSQNEQSQISVLKQQTIIEEQNKKIDILLKEIKLINEKLK